MITGRHKSKYLSKKCFIVDVKTIFLKIRQHVSYNTPVLPDESVGIEI